MKPCYSSSVRALSALKPCCQEGSSVQSGKGLGLAEAGGLPTNRDSGACSCAEVVLQHLPTSVFFLPWAAVELHSQQPAYTTLHCPAPEPDVRDMTEQSITVMKLLEWCSMGFWNVSKITR
ncbi:calcium/calmodulin-dependent protein kinase type 1B-like [Tachysurus ichikawai]